MRWVAVTVPRCEGRNSNEDTSSWDQHAMDVADQGDVIDMLENIQAIDALERIGWERQWQLCQIVDDIHSRKCNPVKVNPSRSDIMATANVQRLHQKRHFPLFLVRALKSLIICSFPLVKTLINIHIE